MIVTAAASENCKKNPDWKYSGFCLLAGLHQLPFSTKQNELKAEIWNHLARALQVLCVCELHSK
jgi:hypothetical protein